MSAKRPSRLQRSLSWLIKTQAGKQELPQAYDLHIDKRVSAPSQDSNLTALMMETVETYNIKGVSLPELGTTLARPPPFFYSRPLSPTAEYNYERERNRVSIYDKGRGSTVSIASSEIARWKPTVSEVRQYNTHGSRSPPEHLETAEVDFETDQVSFPRLFSKSVQD